MKKLSFVRKYSAMSFAFLALAVAQIASVQFSFIFYQNEIPETLRR